MENCRKCFTTKWLQMWGYDLMLWVEKESYFSFFAWFLCICHLLLSKRGFCCFHFIETIKWEKRQTLLLFLKASTGNRVVCRKLTWLWCLRCRCKGHNAFFFAVKTSRCVWAENRCGSLAGGNRCRANCGNRVGDNSRSPPAGPWDCWSCCSGCCGSALLCSVQVSKQTMQIYCCNV